MIRLFALPAVAACLVMAGCQPGPGADGGEGRPSLPAAGGSMPASYDWHFEAHGGSGNLSFGGADGPERVSVFDLSCLPGSKTVEMSWGYPGEAVLTAGTATGTFKAGSSAATNHPVFAALKSSGAIAVGLSGADMVLSARPAGRSELAAFYDYCEEGVAAPLPADSVEPEVLVATEADLEADVPEVPVDGAALPEVEPVPEP